MYKLDVKDRKIIYELSLNARQSEHQIAKKVRLSQQVVNYRIKNLESNKIIKYYYTGFDISKIGYADYKMYLKLKNLDENKENEFIQYLVQNPHTAWVATCDGTWDLFYFVKAKNIFEFNDTYAQIRKKYSPYIEEYSIVTNTKVINMTRKYLAPSQNDIDYSTAFVTWGNSIEQLQLDKTDYQIMLALSQDARCPINKIAEKINSSRKVVAYRLKKLIDSKIIFGFRPRLNGDLLGFKTYKILLSTRGLTAEKEQQLRSYLMHHPNIIDIVYCLGGWDIELDVECHNIEVYLDLLRYLKNRFTEVIHKKDVLMIYKSYKFDYLPAGIQEIQDTVGAIS